MNAGTYVIRFAPNMKGKSRYSKPAKLLLMKNEKLMKTGRDNGYQDYYHVALKE